MAFQGERFAERYGDSAAAHTPPVKRMLEMGVPVGGGTDATRVSSYNPWVALYWLTAGRTVGGKQIYGEATRLSRETALELYTRGSAWFSSEGNKKGAIKAGMLADLTVLDRDYFRVPEAEIKAIEAELTVVGGRIVYAQGAFSSFSPPPIPILPDWSPTRLYNGYYPGAGRTGSAPGLPVNGREPAAAYQAQYGQLLSVHQCAGSCGVHGHGHDAARRSNVPVTDYTAFWGALGCSCFAF
jgi:hypothetical protein